ncbi:MAG: hypothetical protein VYB10_03655 [Actinomycetota bacterium]|nr:hypothetical protein [Acidimicrobiales bacterium]MEE2806175.1 hypothetical protein [Actinomycetota bacterium]|tara:strand:+ start:12929 stop:13282 length:354 start_codon:yes stop_codon:yes gene_type:complete
MTVWDLVAVVVTVCAIVTMAVLLLVLFHLISVLRELRSAADRLADDALPAVDVLRETVDHADIELRRLQGVIGAAEEVSENLRSAGRAATRIATTPAIKGRAILAGFRSGIGRLKRG